MKRMMVGLLVVIGYGLPLQSLHGMAATKTKQKNKAKQTEQQLKTQAEAEQLHHTESVAATQENGIQHHAAENLEASICGLNLQENYAPQQKQIPPLETSSSFTKAVAVAQVMKKSPSPVSMASSSSSTSSIGSFVDGITEKISNNIWGHAVNIIETIKTKKFDKNNTNHVNSLNRAIDECIEGNKQQTFMELMELCMGYEIQINSSHIEKVEAFIKQIGRRVVAINGSFATMKKRIAENLQITQQADDFDIDSIE